MVRILVNPHTGEKEFAISPTDLDFFGEVAGRIMRPQQTQLPSPTANMLQALPEPMLLPTPAPQHLLMPSPDSSPEPHSGVMPGADRPVTAQFTTAGPVRIKKPSVSAIALAFVMAHRRQFAIAGISLVGAIFLWFAGGMIVRKVAPEAEIEVGEIEAIGDPEVKGVEEAPPTEEPAPEPAPAVQFPTFPLIPQK